MNKLLELWGDRQNRFLLLATLIVAVVLVSLFVYLGFGQKSNQPTVSSNSSDQQENPLDLIDIDLVESNLYQLDQLDFRFIIAKFRIVAPEAMLVDISELVTSEGIKLSNVDAYLEAMQEANLYVGKKNVAFELNLTGGNQIVNLFIPITTNQSTLSLQTPFENAKFDFDLKVAAITDSTDFYYVPTETVSDGETYEIIVTNAFEITGEVLYRDGFEDSYPSTAQLYAFTVEIKSLSDESIVIEKAQYTTSSGIVFEALDETYSTEKRFNIMGVTVSQSDKGCLLFITLNPDQQPIVYTGELLLKLKGSDEWIRVQVTL
ncbi:MAG: hypothetical protein LBR25_09155 [Erysipelotrichaceae bacterium]|nr:hypothetical protein [Erysipelotrichaceae bacterium]